MQPDPCEADRIARRASAHPAHHRQRLHAAQNLRRVVEEDLVHDPRLPARPSSLCCRIRSSATGSARGPDTPPLGVDIGPAVRSVAAPAPGRRARSKLPCAVRGAPADVVTTSRSSPSALATIFDSSGSRNVESSTIRSSGRLRSRPVRSVSSRSSDSTVPMPVRIASEMCRICLHMRPRPLAGDPAGVVFRRRNLPVQRHGRLQGHQRQAGARRHAGRPRSIVPLRPANTPGPVSTSTPASRSLRKPRPATSGFGSSMAATTAATPASINASAQGGVRPWCEHGSSVTYSVAPRASAPASAKRHHFGMPSVCVDMKAAPDDLAIPHQHRPHRRIRTGPPQPFPGQRPAPRPCKKFASASGSLEQRSHELFGVERQQIVHLFAHPDIADRQVQLARDRDHDAAFGRAVQLGQNDAR